MKNAALLLLLLATACSAAPPSEPAPVAPPPPPMTAATTIAPPPRSPFADLEPRERAIEMILAPRRDGQDITSIDVALRFASVPGELGDTTPLTIEAPARVAAHIDEVEGRDSDGALAFQRLPYDGRGAPDIASWRASRRQQGSAFVSYRVKLDKAKGTSLLARAGGVEGEGADLFLLPKLASKTTFRLRWDLASLGEDAAGVSTFGAGDTLWEGSIEKLRKGFFLAGSVARVAVERGSAKFQAVWLGTLPRDPVDLAATGARSFEALRAHFGDTAPVQYTLLFKSGEASRADGQIESALCVVSPPGAAPSASAKVMIGAAITRRWTGAIKLDVPVLDEGIELYVAREVLLRRGLVSVSEYGDDLDAIALDTSGGGAKAKGLFAAAELDHLVRARSQNKVWLGDVLAQLAKRAGTGLGADAVREALRKELGSDGSARFDAMMRGGEPNPPDTAFGPCFQRVKGRKQGSESVRYRRAPRVLDTACVAR